jgi:ATP-binding cassette subfamily C protein
MRTTTGVTRVLLTTLRGHPRDLVRLAGWSVVEVIPVYVSGRAIALAVDEGFRHGRLEVGLGWLGLLAVAVLAGAIAVRRIYLLLASIVEPFRDELVRRVVAGAVHRAATGDDPPGAVGVARLTRQVEVVRDSFAGMVMVVRGFAFTVTGALLGLLSLNPAVLAFVVPPFAVGLGVFLASLSTLAARQRRLTLADEEVAGAVGALTGGLRDIVAAGGEDRTRASVGARVDAQAAATRALAWLTTVRTFALTVGGWLPVVLLVIGAPWLLRRGASPGSILGALTYILYALQPALQTLVHAVGGSGLQLAINLGRIIETGHTEPALPASARTGPAARTEPECGGPGPDRQGAARRAGHDLELREVTFAYGPHVEPVVEHLDLTVPAGDHLVIVGPSGVGKSTLALLMAGLLSPQSGLVRLGGVPVAALDGAYRVLIPQEAYVFTGTLAENLTYLRPDAPAPDLDAAVELVGSRPLVDRLGGYDAIVAPSALSAGERQLIALTRSYLSPAPIAILDEAACHLDLAAEARAERAFARRPGTLVVIAHRMSSAMRAARILVMDGVSTQLGDHSNLLASSPLYQDLVGHWGTSEPTLLAGDPDGVDAVTGPRFVDDPGQVIADGANRQA